MRLLLPTLAAALSVTACSKPETLAEPVRAVRTLTVATDLARPTQDFAAEVRARTESRLSFRVGGKLVERSADLGESVRAGQVLARLDPRDLQLAQQAARAGIDAAQASLDQAESDLRRARELRDQGFISTAELDRRDTAVKAARAQLEQARLQAGVQGNQASYAVLAATAAGVVTAVDAEPGAVVSAGMPIVRLAHDGPRDVVFSVPEDRVGQVRALAAQPGAFTMRPWGSTQDLPVKVREIAAAADPTTRTFLVKADTGPAAAAVLRLGQTATVTMRAPAQPGVVKLPLTALREDQGRTTVWIVDAASMTVRSQPVQMAGADGNEAVIAAGLAPGQRVVTAGVHVLTAGQKVRLYGAPAGPDSAAVAAPAPASAASR